MLASVSRSAWEQDGDSNCHQYFSWVHRRWERAGGSCLIGASVCPGTSGCGWEVFCLIRLGFSCMLPPFGAVPLSAPETLGHYCQKARVLGTKARAVRCTQQWIGGVETKRCAHTPSSLCPSSGPGLGMQGCVRDRAWL